MITQILFCILPIDKSFTEYCKRIKSNVYDIWRILIFNKLAWIYISVFLNWFITIHAEAPFCQLSFIEYKAKSKYVYSIL